MIKRTCRIICIITLFIGPSYAAQDIYLGLSASGDRVDVGLAGFKPATPTPDELRVGKQLQEVLRYDILFSRYFNLIDEALPFTGTEQNYSDWDAKGADIVIAGDIRLVEGDVVASCRLIDVGSRQEIWKKELRDRTANIRGMAHAFSDEVIRRFTGEMGIAHTRIVFANRNQSGKEIYIIDYDGYNMRKLTSGGSINMFPRWSPDGKEVIFTTFKYGNPDLYSISPDGGNTTPLSRKQGLNATGSFSTDGQRLVLTMSLGKDPSLYLLERTGKIVRQLTYERGIETSPSFSPNGKEIAFISDKPGYPQLYIMSLDGGNQRRLPARGYCDSPAWSPRGDRIVFTMREGRGNYDLYVYELATSKVFRLTQGSGTNENPSWSPDGRFIVFSSNRDGKYNLYIIGADGSGARKLGKIAGDSTMPSWGP